MLLPRPVSSLASLLLLLAAAVLPTTAAAQWTLQSPLPSGLAVRGLVFLSPTHGFLANSGSEWDGGNRRALLETQDGGATWVERLVPVSDFEGLNGVGFLDAQHGWVFGNVSYRTADGGQTWTPMSFLGSIYGMQFHTPTFVSAVGNFGFARSSNAGQTWQLVSTGPRRFAFRDAQVGLGVGTDGIWRTTNGGASFTNVLSGPADAIAWVGPTDAVAIAADLVLRSVDDGQTWTAVAAAQGRNRLQPVQPGVVLAWSGSGVVPNPDGQLLRSADGGQTWTDLGTVFPRGTGSFAVGGAPVVFAADTTADVWRSLDAGATWSLVFDAPFVGFSTFPIQAPDAATVYLAYGHGGIWKSSDGGASFDQISNGFGQDLTDVDRLGPEALVAVGIDGTVLRTEDGGQNWNLIEDGVESYHDLAAVQALDPANVLTVTSRGLVLASVDGARTWSIAGAVPDPTVEFYAGDLHFRTPLEGWVVGTRYNLPAVYHTTTGGQSWQVVPLVGLFLAVDFEGDNGWIADNRGSYYRTGNGGQTWTFGTFPPDAVQLDILDLEFFDENVGYVVGRRGYVARSTDGGVTWTRMPSPGANVHLSDLSLTAANDVWASTYDGRVYRSFDGGATFVLESLQALPLSFGSFTGVAAQPDGRVWAVGFKGFVHARDAWPNPAGRLPFGSGCGVPGFVPQLDTAGGTLPWLGETLVLRASALRPATVVVLALGFSATSWNGTPLPLALDGLGMTGCALLASADAAPAFAAAGSVTIPWPLPQNVAFLGLTVFAQALALDPAANAMGAVLSNGLRLQFGDR